MHMQYEHDNYVIEDCNYQAKVFKGFDEMRKELKFHDVELMCKDSNGRILNGHKILLSSSSTVFRTIFSMQSTAQNQQSMIVYLHCAKYEVLSLLLDFIYTGSVKVSAQHFDDFFELAREFRVICLYIDDMSESTEQAEAAGLTLSDNCLNVQYNTQNSMRSGSETLSAVREKISEPAISNVNIPPLESFRENTPKSTSDSENNNIANEDTGSIDAADDEANPLFLSKANVETSPEINENTHRYENECEIFGFSQSKNSIHKNSFTRSLRSTTKNENDKSEIIAEIFGNCKNQIVTDWNRKRLERSMSPEIFGFCESEGFIDFRKNFEIQHKNSNQETTLQLKSQDMKEDIKGCREIRRTRSKRKRMPTKDLEKNYVLHETPNKSKNKRSKKKNNQPSSHVQENASSMYGSVTATTLCIC